MTQVNAQSKSLLAKLLATENIIIQRLADASTAAFDLKKRTLYLPLWQGISNDLEDMLVVHEVGHALDTPSTRWLKAIEKVSLNIFGNKSDGNVNAIKGFMNVIEDARIDKRQKRRYPGARRNYLIGYKELIERDFFGTAKRDINSFSFIDRMNMYFKGGFNAGIKFDKEEMPFVKRVENAETFDEVITLTEEIFLFCKEKGEIQRQKMAASLLSDETDEDDAEGQQFVSVDDDDDDFDDIFGNDDDEGEGSNDSDDDGDAGNQDDTENKQGGSTEGEYVPESETDKSWQNKQKEILAANGNTRYHYVTIPKMNPQNIFSDYKSFLEDSRKAYGDKAGCNYYGRVADNKWLTEKRTEMINYRNNDNATISFMVKEFEMKKSADIFSRISVAKTGVIDTNRIYSYKYNDDVFRRQSIIPEGKNHGFVMVLDWSGSMQTNIKETVKQLISLTSFCKRTQIPFEVYIFRDMNNDEQRNRGNCFDFSVDYSIRLNRFTMRNVLSSRMSSSELIEAYAMLWCMCESQTRYDNMGGTPLNQAIIATEEAVKRFKASNKVQIVNVIFLTDGESNQIEGINGTHIDRWDAFGKRVQNIYILQDKDTGRDYQMAKDYYSSPDVTVALLKRLKDRTGCNLIGFYLYDNSSYKRVQQQYFGYNVDAKFSEEMNKSWKENKFIPVASQGYDDYYIINTPAMKESTNILTVSPDMKKAQIAKEFMKFSEKKSINRILLKRFIDKVA